MAKTLFDKIWQSHLVDVQDDGTCVLYIDRHLVHEVTSPQAFEGLRAAGRRVRRPEATLAVADHNVPTLNRAKGVMIRNRKSKSIPWPQIAMNSACPISPWTMCAKASCTSSARNRA